MRVVVQRSKEASVSVDSKIVGQIDHGLVLLVGFCEGDNKQTIEYMAKKIVGLRIFDDSNEMMNLSILDVKGSILSISQFTLYADCSKGCRPSWQEAMKADKARVLYECFNQELKKYVRVASGVFQENMQVQLVNDGPVTIVLSR